MGDQEWCRYCTYSSGYLENLYCNKHYRYVDKYDWCDYFIRSETKESGGCYIATATLHQPDRIFALQQFRRWRAERMRPHRFGRWLEERYDSVGPRVVALISDKPQVGSWYYRLYIRPATDLLRKRNRSRMPWLFDVVGYLLLIGLIVTGQFHVWLAHK